MYKTDIVRKVAKETRLSQRIVADVLTESLKTITQALREGKRVTVPGFGTFYPSPRQAGTVRHIRTDELIEAPARHVAPFRPGTLLRRAVRQQKPARIRSHVA